MNIGKIAKALMTVFAVYKANEEELKPIVNAAKKVVKKKKNKPTQPQL
jgi:hypothetical protein